LVTNSTELTASVDRFSRVAEQLPRQLSAEREAIVKDLQSQEKQLTPLVNDVRQTLLAGSQMSTSLNTTLITFDSLMKRFGVGDTNAVVPPDTNSPPFNILDYAQTATQLGAAAQRLTELMRTLDQTMGSTNLAKLSTEAAPAIQSAQSAGKEVVDYAFRRIVWLIVIGCVCVLLTVWIGRMTRARPVNSERDSK
ncbi:MAG: hypothetical protein H7X97_04120, partial [Opitutaceae bacterium]|nr:hypothetical protein [Verrucomicrobiales bacterium]